MYKDLPLSDRARIIQLAVLSGISDLRTIESVYNKFAAGGNLEEENAEFVGPPTPASVKVKKETADYYNQMAEYYAYKYPGKYPNLEHYLRRSGELRAEQLAANEEDFLDYNKNLVNIRGTQSHNVSVPRAVLDSIALNGAKAGISPEEALGIPAQESNFGFYPTAYYSKEQMRNYSKENPKGFAVNQGGITPIELLNDAAYANNPYGNSLSYVSKKLKLGNPIDDSSHMIVKELEEEDLDRLEEELTKDRAYTDRQARKFNSAGSIFRHAYTLYKNGNYNPGDPTYNESVLTAGQDVMSSPQIQNWWETSGRKYYEQYAPTLLESYKNGGKIHIKKENRGKFTALKKRTGHSASWFKAHGTPAQRKMATFALNARKWHH